VETKKWTLKKQMKVYQLADNIISSLGFTTTENTNAVISGISGVKFFPVGEYQLPESFFASKVEDNILDSEFKQFSHNNKAITRFEKMAILSICHCTQNLNIDLSSKRTLFILSTTKGNVRLLEEKGTANLDSGSIFLSHSAKIIADFFGNTNKPVVLSNACISGVSAQIVAKRLLQSDAYDHVVVVGAEELSKFIISGFQSFKALSPDVCKPFDANRTGLNLGEGAATIIYGKIEKEDELPANTIILEDGAVTNDANHISGPSRTGEGLYLALKSILQNAGEDLGFINAHGTATPYNDEMEAIAINRAGLNKIPVNSFKGYYGHTLGAAGLIETVISSACLKNNTLIKSIGYEECGVSQPLNIIQKTIQSPIISCIKMVSGFGGCNAAILLRKVN
jgi:3-oxoacyl-[acyl-carrier-protein] synthase I